MLYLFTLHYIAMNQVLVRSITCDDKVKANRVDGQAYKWLPSDLSWFLVLCVFTLSFPCRFRRKEQKVEKDMS